MVIDRRVAVAEMQRRRKADPLAYRLFSSKAQRELVRAVCQDVEVLFESGNMGGKTDIGAALTVAFLRGVEELDGRTIREARDGTKRWGLKLPLLAGAKGEPVHGYLVVPGHKQSIHSSVKALFEYLGTHPHKAVYATGEAERFLSMLYVKPDGCDSDDISRWSTLTVFVDKGIPPEGGRIDFAWADELPSERVWREVRFRRQRGKMFPMYTTGTPLERSRWWWWSQDFKLAEGVIHAGRLKLRTRIYDNEALSDEDIRKQVEKAAGDPFAEARLNGIEVDTENMSPWGPTRHLELQRRLDACEAGLPTIITLQKPIGERTRFEVTVERWWDVEPDNEYILVADPSKGLFRRDPMEFVILSRRVPRIVAAFNSSWYDEWIDGFSLGLLMAHWAEVYNDALIDWDCTGGYGESVGDGLEAYTSLRHPRGYKNLNHDDSSVDPRQMRGGWGFNIDSATRNSLVSCVRQFIDDWMYTGQGPLVLSSRLIRNIMDLTMDPDTGKIVAPDGLNDETLTTLGRALYLNNRLELAPVRERRRTPAEERERLRELFRGVYGKDVLTSTPNPQMARALEALERRRRRREGFMDDIRTD